ncbi:RDD family protein [Dongia deserti]|uniref:RDD family protein n=1 Tax=Dongia deserti TaxID=2268030 RepID=UPI000E65502E|nr:RDD family protein [Dongia deserti]
MTDARLYAATSQLTRGPLERAESGRRQAAILTPEGVELRVELAERGERAGAFLIDALIIVAAVIALVFLTLYLMTALEGYALAAGLVVFFFIRTFYFAFFELLWRGRTPGKRLIGLRVIDRAGGPLRPSSIVVRNLLREIEVFLPLSVMMMPETVGNAAWIRLFMTIWIGIFALMPLFNRQGLRVGDMVAGTLVVASPKAALLPDLVEKAVSPASIRRMQPASVDQRFTFTPQQLEHYGIYELQTLEAVLRRDDVHASQTRREIAERIRKKIGWTEEQAGWDLRYDGLVTEFLQAFYVAQRAHLEHKMLFGKRRRDKHDKV